MLDIIEGSNLGKRSKNHLLLTRTISIEETFVFPESVSIISVEVIISFFDTPSRNRLRAISAVSTARDFALPLALIATSSAQLLNWVITART
jgi:hypothetical protein